MRKAIQNALAAVIAFLEKEEPKNPCVCITDEDHGHHSDCKVGIARDRRLRREEASWVLEQIEDMLAEVPDHAWPLEKLRARIDQRWRLR